MDLLRLVLARQPAASLERLAKLIKSESFLQARRSLYSLQKLVLAWRTWNFTYESAFNGDVGPNYVVESSDERGPSCRAAFLCNPSMVGYFLFRSSEFDFWYLLSTGIREIQEAVIGRMKTFNIDIIGAMLVTLNDPGNFPWNDWLDNQILDLTVKVWNSDTPLTIRRSQLLKIFGAVRYILPKDFFKDQAIQWRDYLEYVKFFTLRVLRGEDSRERNELIETIMENTPSYIDETFVKVVATSYGYIHDMEVGPIGNFHFSIMISSFSYECIKYLMERHPALLWNLSQEYFSVQLVSCPVLTKRMVLQARLCLDDPAVRDSLPGEILELVKLVAAQSDSKTTWVDFLQLTGVPVETDEPLKFAPLAWHGLHSIQGSQIIDPVWAFNITDSGVLRSLALTMAFTRGQLGRTKSYS